MSNSNFKLTNDGVQLYFSKVFSEHGGLKNKLKQWFQDCFRYTRCEFNVKYNWLKVYYRDEKAKFNLKNKILQFQSDKAGQGINLVINLTGSLTDKPAEKFVGDEFICNFDGISEVIYTEFFTTDSKTMLQTIKESAQIKGMVEYGKLNRIQIESILQEYQNPFRRGLN